MAMKVTETSLAGVMVVEPDVFRDERGFFMESYHEGRYGKEGVTGRFVQDNWSHSVRGTLRGLHYQLEHPQGKLVMAVSGEIFDVAVDIRQGSASFGKWVGVRLGGENRKQLYVPAGFAHGFCVISDFADVIYKCTEVYTPGDDYGILWSDPAIGIDWPIDDPILSAKDAGNPRLSEAGEDHLPRW